MSSIQRSPPFIPATAKGIEQALEQTKEGRVLSPEQVSACAQRIRDSMSPVHPSSPFRSEPSPTPGPAESADPRFYPLPSGAVAFPNVLIGAGADKEVYSALLVSGDGTSPVALLRTVPRQRAPSSLVQDWNRTERNLLEQLVQNPRPGLVSVFEICREQPSEGQSQFAALQELYDGDLLSLIKSRNPDEQLPEWQKRHLMHQMLRSVYELHNKGSVHRDVKPENFLIKIFGNQNAVNGRISVRLADFAYAVDLRSEDRIPNSICGSALYLSPEYIQLTNTYRGQKLPDNAIQERTSTKVDLWALGIVFLWMTDKTLYDRIAPSTPQNIWVQLWSNYYNNRTIAAFPKPADPESMRHLIWEMLRPRPEERISARDALAKMERIQLESRDPIAATPKMIEQLDRDEEGERSYRVGKEFALRTGIEQQAKYLRQQLSAPNTKPGK